MKTKTCPQCGEEFEGRENKVYCSDACKVRAFRAQSDNGVTDFDTDTESVTSNATVLENPLQNVTKSVTVTLKNSEYNVLLHQATSCDTDIETFIRIRSLMDETNMVEKEALIEKQQKELQELKIKLSFYKSNKENVPNNGTETVTLVELPKRQYEYLQKKYLESFDFNGNAIATFNDGFVSRNERIMLEREEQETPGFIKSSISGSMLFDMFHDIEQRFISEHGHDKEDYEDFPLIYEMEKVK